MLNLSEGMFLYHGSYTIVNNIDLSMCKKGKDFGRGFYLTSSYEQAKQFVKLSIKRELKVGSPNGMQSKGFVSFFQVNDLANLESFIFDGATRDWLHFVASNRRTDLFQALKKEIAKFDVIGGKIANDRTAQTLQLYIAGAYGEPGSEMADHIAIMTLLPNRLQDQYCFRSMRAIQSLQFIKGEECHVNW